MKKSEENYSFEDDLEKSGMTLGQFQKITTRWAPQKWYYRQRPTPKIAKAYLELWRATPNKIKKTILEKLDYSSQV